MTESHKEELTQALIAHSNGKIDNKEAEHISSIVMSIVSFYDYPISHKGVNWLAKEIIDMLEKTE